MRETQSINMGLKFFQLLLDISYDSYMVNNNNINLKISMMMSWMMSGPISGLSSRVVIILHNTDIANPVPERERKGEREKVNER